MSFLSETSTNVSGLGTTSGIITAVSVVIIALSGLFGTLAVFLPKLKEVMIAIGEMKNDVKTVHTLVNGRATAADAYQADLIAALTEANLPIPPKPPVPEEGLAE